MKKNDRTVVKVKLKNILYDDINYKNLFKCIDDSNTLITNGYLFLRSFVLHIIENNFKNATKIREPKINIEFIRLVFSVLISNNSKKQGRPFNASNREYLTEINKFLNIFKKKTSFEPIIAKNISYIMGSKATWEKIFKDFF